MKIKYKKCRTCSKEFRLYKSTERFCSPWCHYEGTKDKKKPKKSDKLKGTELEYKLNRAVKVKENKEKNGGFLNCEYCGVTGEVEAHHLIYRSEKPRHEHIHNKKNLILLCRKCHNWMHENKSNRNDLVLIRGLKDLFGNVYE